MIQKIKGSDKRHGGNTFKAHSRSMFTSDGRRNTAVKIALFKKQQQLYKQEQDSKQTTKLI